MNEQTDERVAQYFYLVFSCWSGPQWSISSVRSVITRVFSRFVTGHSKKVYCNLNYIEKCGFLHGVQCISNIIFKVFLDLANF